MQSRIRRLQNKYTTDKHLNKAESNNLSLNTCPYCAYAYMCRSESKDGAEKICLFKSTESHRVWLRITEDRPKIEIGKTYGRTTVLSFSHSDDNNSLYWNCDREGVPVVVRGANLLRIELDNKPERKYRRGSSVNPDGLLHIYPMEHHSKAGCAIETTKTEKVVNDEGCTVKHRYEIRVLCSCGGTMRYDEYGDAICDRCIGMARRTPKPCLDPEIKPHQPIDWLGKLKAR